MHMQKLSSNQSSDRMIELPILKHRQSVEPKLKFQLTKIGLPVLKEAPLLPKLKLQISTTTPHTRPLSPEPAKENLSEVNQLKAKVL